MNKILITGGAGFVGSYIARYFKQANSFNKVTVCDNLHRRGSEANLEVFKKLGIEFHHVDIRQFSDLEDLQQDFDILIEASAEPSVHAGIGNSPNYVLQTNLVGTLNCLEFARRRVENLLFLSTSRVYSIAALQAINLDETETRFKISDEQHLSGISTHGVEENFSTSSARSLYGATKLASEILIQEYAFAYSMKAVINRCGVIAGAGQFGKVDQGIFTLWVANHFFKKGLAYWGYNGTGKQVRDLIHPRDLCELIKIQLENIEQVTGEVFNVGGGTQISTSLCELTELCQKITGNKVTIEKRANVPIVDIPVYISDYRKAQSAFNWHPEIGIEAIIQDILEWLVENEAQLKYIFN